MERMLANIVIRVMLCLSWLTMYSSCSSSTSSGSNNNHRIIDVKRGSVVWVVQLSDLHFSVHHPERALDFETLVSPALSVINPSLVLITGDLTDGKSKDLLTMKQNEKEWIEYHNTMDFVARTSGLNKDIFFDLRGNHDCFGVPYRGSSHDYFSNYSINAHFARAPTVNSVTLETARRKHLFVGFDSAMHVGLRGPTNLFGHPTDDLLTDLEIQLSQWDSQSAKPVTKISFGHFPLSFSASSHSGKTLKHVFLKHSLSAYLCGHLHTRFGKNLKRQHQLSHPAVPLHKFFQLNLNQVSPQTNSSNCSSEAPLIEEFWEWEIGDWRKSRSMRILAIDKGHVSYVDFDLKSGTPGTFILPTFPLDSQFMSRSSARHTYECQMMAPASYETIRALVFSISNVRSVVARVYDSRLGSLNLVLEAPMSKHVDETSLYVAPWNYQAFEDPSPDRYWLQIEVTDITGRSIMTDLRPFSINGLSAKVSWTWKEFFVMGCQWEALYYPVLWSVLYVIFSLLLFPKFLLVFSKKAYTHRRFITNKSFLNKTIWALQELSRVPTIWFSLLLYLLYTIFFPWFIGQVFTEGKQRGYMTYRGWVVKTSSGKRNHEYIGCPDVMVLVLPHLCFVVLPGVLVVCALVADGVIRRECVQLSGKKKDDYDPRSSTFNENQSSRPSRVYLDNRWFRKVLCALCLVICWKHAMNCIVLMKAYEMNPLLHFPVFGFSIPLFLAYAIYKTSI